MMFLEMGNENAFILASLTLGLDSLFPDTVRVNAAVMSPFGKASDGLGSGSDLCWHKECSQHGKRRPPELQSSKSLAT